MTTFRYRITLNVHLTSGAVERHVVYDQYSTPLSAALESKLVLTCSEVQYELFAELFAYVTVDKVEYLGKY